MKRPTVKQDLTLKLLAAAAFTVAAGMGSTLATAQSLTTAEAQQRYQADVERCRSGQASQDERTCLREAGAALQEARRNRLVSGSATFDENQRARCDRLSGTQREDCLLLMGTPNVVTHGSVEGGGIIRETTITVPADNMQTPGSGGLAPAGTTPNSNVKPGALTPDYSPQPAPAGGLAPAPRPAQ